MSSTSPGRQTPPIIAAEVRVYASQFHRAERAAAKAGQTLTEFLGEAITHMLSRIEKTAADAKHGARWLHMQGMKPRLGFLFGYFCSTCNHFFAGQTESSHRSAAYCCGPWLCTTCGSPRLKTPYSTCDRCQTASAVTSWEALERKEAGDAMIYAGATHEWFNDLECFVEHCVDNDVDPRDLLPVIAAFEAAEAPTLSEHITDDMPEDWETPAWLDALQDQVEAAFAEHKPGAYWPGKCAPILPEWPIRDTKEQD